jgi:hypothetical protein
MAQSPKRLRVQTWTSILDYVLHQNPDTLCDFLTPFEVGVVSQTCSTYFRLLDTCRFNKAKNWAIAHCTDKIDDRLLILSWWFRQKHDGHFTSEQFDELAKSLVNEVEVDRYYIEEISYKLDRNFVDIRHPWLPWDAGATKTTLSRILRYRFPASLVTSSKRWGWLSEFRISDLMILGYAPQDFIQCDLRKSRHLISSISCDVSELNWKVLVNDKKLGNRHYPWGFSPDILSILINGLPSKNLAECFFHEDLQEAYVEYRTSIYDQNDLTNLGITSDNFARNLKWAKCIPPYTTWKWLIEEGRVSWRSLAKIPDLFIKPGFPCVIETMKLLFTRGLLNRVFDDNKLNPKYEELRDRIRQASLLQ